MFMIWCAIFLIWFFDFVGLKEYIGANPALKVESTTTVIHAKHSVASSSSGDFDDLDAQDQFYDAIAAASSSSSEDEYSDGDDDDPAKRVCLSTFFYIGKSTNK